MTPDNNWDLNAIVRPYISNPTPNTNNLSSESTLSILSSIEFEPEEDSFLLKSPKKVFNTNSMNQFQSHPNSTGLTHKKPLTPNPVPVSVPAPVPTITMAPRAGSSVPVTYRINDSKLQNSTQKPLQKSPQRPRTGEKRKKMESNMVRHVKEEDLNSDLWRWRKYGQKSINGLIYPRSYYRCSSVEGCPARKLVDRSNEDQNMYMVTYHGDHSHPLSLHQNTLVRNSRVRKPIVSSIPEPKAKENSDYDIVQLAGTLEEDALAELVAGLDDIPPGSGGCSSVGGGEDRNFKGFNGSF